MSWTPTDEQARAEAEKRYPNRYHGSLKWAGDRVQNAYVDGFLAGHEATTRTRVVTTASELVELKVGSVILDQHGVSWQKEPALNLWDSATFSLDPLAMLDHGRLPARVLYEPEEGR